MKSLIISIAATLGMVSPALAANGTAGSGSSFLLILFLGFAALIVVFQFIPGLVLLLSMLKGIFSEAPRSTSVVHGRK